MATRKKKRTTEARFKVKKGRDNAGALDVDDDTIDAADSADAVKQAMDGDPNADSYEQIRVSKDSGGGPRTKPQTVSKVKPQTTGMLGYESIDYPYNIGLPLGFNPLFESMTKALKENLTIRTRYGRLHIEIPDAETMEAFMNEAERRARGKTDVKHMAVTVVNGINESVKK